MRRNEDPITVKIKAAGFSVEFQVSDTSEIRHAAIRELYRQVRPKSKNRSEAIYDVAGILNTSMRQIWELTKEAEKEFSGDDI